MDITMYIQILHTRIIILRWHLLPQAITRGSTIYKSQLVETRAGKIMLRTTLRNARWSSQYEPQFVLSTQD